jgi:hypothetical protein
VYRSDTDAGRTFFGVQLVDEPLSWTHAESILLFMRFLFANGFARLYFEIPAFNASLIRTARRYATEHGTLTAHCWLGGRYVDLRVYSTTAQDLASHRRLERWFAGSSR